jgi:putative transposase
LDAAFGQFFKTLEYIAEKAGSVVIEQKPAYTSMILSYRNEIIFTDCGLRHYWDKQYSLMVDRDINAAINLKKLGLDIFPSIKRARRESFYSRNYRPMALKKSQSPSLFTF